MRKKLALLSPRERQVMELVIAGKMNKSIANDLEISVKTVEMHRSHLMKKLRVESLVELVRLTIGAKFSTPSR